jgi:hypothetical protein
MWSRELVLAHLHWWSVRVDGLPLFPFRIRLFGSHGSTQAAVWIGGCLVLASYWLLPRLSGVWRWIGGFYLIWCSLLLGFCDSRLAMAGIFAAVLVAGLSGRGGLLVAFATILPNAIWWLRDHLHPSQVAAGGGVMQGKAQFLFSVCVWTLVVLFRFWPRSIPTKPLRQVAFLLVFFHQFNVPCLASLCGWRPRRVGDRPA